MRRWGLPAAAAAVATMAAAPASGAMIEVTTGADEFGQGGSSACALREAIEAARTNKAFGGCPKGSKRKPDTVKLNGNAVLTRAGNTATNADGDLDYDGDGKLTILGSEDGLLGAPDVSISGFNNRHLEITGGRVTVRGVELSGGSGVTAGGAMRVADDAKLKLRDVSVHDNLATSVGGGVACQGCASLRLAGGFQLTGNTVASFDDAQGGGVWSDGPLVIAGNGNPITGPASIAGNTVAPGPGDRGRGGGVLALGDVTISNTSISGNEVGGFGNGGGIAGPPSEAGIVGQRISLDRVTLSGNASNGRGGGIEAFGTDLELSVKRTAIVNNEATGFPAPTETSFGGGVFTHSDATFVDSVVANNTVAAETASAAAQGGGIYLNSANEPEPSTLRLVRTSVTDNSIVQGGNRWGGGLFVLGNLRMVNSTISGNSAATAGDRGGGIYIRDATDAPSFASIAFSTIKGNAAGTGADDGDGIYSDLSVSAPGGFTLRASILDQSGDACAGGDFATGGYNVQENEDPTCALDAPTDVHTPDFLAALIKNGSPGVGVEGLFGPETIPLTHAFTNNLSPALDRVPSKKCKFEGKKLTVDARGAPRPAGEACDSGATERTACLGAFVVGPNSRIGTKGADQIQGDSNANVILAQTGDDQVNTYNGADSVCAGPGDDGMLIGENSPSADAIAGGSGRDFISYNNGGTLTLDLAAGTGDGVSSGMDTLTAIEDAQGSEGPDTLLGTNGPNLLIGGGDPDTIKGRGGIDAVDAKDGEADIQINCGPGKNSKEKAKYDKGLDPKPKSC